MKNRKKSKRIRVPSYKLAWISFEHVHRDDRERLLCGDFCFMNKVGSDGDVLITFVEPRFWAQQKRGWRASGLGPDFIRLMHTLYKLGFDRVLLSKRGDVVEGLTPL